MNRNATILLSIIVIIGGFVAVFLLSGYIEKNRPAMPENYVDEDLSLQGARLKGYSLGAEGLIADWYWMRSLHYLGNKIVDNPDARISIDNLNSLNPRLLYPLLDNASTLDPRFFSVYEFGATVLPAIDKEQAVALLKKGIAANPNQWRLYQYLGFIYWRLGEYEKASEVYAQGAKIPGAPLFMQMMVAKTKTDGGSPETARAIYQQMFDEAQDEQSKESARVRLLQIDSLYEQNAIRAALQTFKKNNNRCAETWREILPILQPVKLPDNQDFRVDSSNNLIDPSGAPYVLDKSACNVKLDFTKSKVPQN